MAINIAIVEDVEELREFLTEVLKSSDEFLCVGAFADSHHIENSFSKLGAHNKAEVLSKYFHLGQ